MGSKEGLTGPVMVRVLDCSPADAARTAAVSAKLAVECEDPSLYSVTEHCLEDLTRDNTDVLVLDLETIGGESALEPFAVRCPST
ncbi:MAG: sigma-54-dependent Fis family transcriptional regulator, partial [Roseobacter sp.]